MAQNPDPPDLTEPPGAPAVRRRVRLYPGQWIGIPILILIPLLAALGVFGERRETVEFIGAAIRLEVDYPTRLRNGQRSDIEVRVRNLSAAPLDVVVMFDPTYFGRFTRVSFTPGQSAPSEVELTDLEAGRAAVLRVELEGDKPWRNRGRVGVRHAGDTAHVPIRTFILP
jgi:hypothetical protein